jgi:hypothetical protein
MRESIDIRSTRVSQIDEVGRVARVIHTKSLSNYQATHVNREGKMRSDILFWYKHKTGPELVSLVDITTFRHLVQARSGPFTKIYSSSQYKIFHFLSMIFYFETRRHPLNPNPEYLGLQHFYSIQGPISAPSPCACRRKICKMLPTKQLTINHTVLSHSHVGKMLWAL